MFLSWQSAAPPSTFMHRPFREHFPLTSSHLPYSTLYLLPRAHRCEVEEVCSRTVFEGRIVWVLFCLPLPNLNPENGNTVILQWVPRWGAEYFMAYTWPLFIPYFPFIKEANSGGILGSEYCWWSRV